jgi:hypothetical protein
MATKRTKADKSQRQSDRLEKKSERRPEQGTSKKKVFLLRIVSFAADRETERDCLASDAQSEGPVGCGNSEGSSLRR